MAAVLFPYLVSGQHAASTWLQQQQQQHTCKLLPGDVCPCCPPPAVSAHSPPSDLFSSSVAELRRKAQEHSAAIWHQIASSVTGAAKTRPPTSTL
jgi:hypothetical protein